MIDKVEKPNHRRQASGRSDRSTALRSPAENPPPTLRIAGVESVEKVYDLTFNVTIRFRVTEVLRREVTLLAGQALKLVLEEGLTIGDWMTLEFLYNYLLGTKPTLLQVKDSKELEILALLKLVLSSVGYVGPREKVEIPLEVVSICKESRWIPNDRTYQSRKSLYDPQKWLTMRIVGVDDLINRPTNTSRYSSYCKGYGEGSSKGRKGRTPISSELDGEDFNYDDLERVNIPLTVVPLLSECFLIETRLKIQRQFQ